MVKLEFLTDDEGLIALGKAYWAMDDAGAWLHKKVSSLEEMFSVPRGRTHEYVNRACVATSLTPYCSECGAPTVFNSRTEADSFRKAVQRAAAPRFGWTRVCTDCRADARAKQQAAREAEARARHDLVSKWLQEVQQTQAPMDYRSMDLHDAFLLEGLLHYCGDAWRGGELDGWEQHRPQLCGDIADIRNVYERLYRAGWLMPNVNSPLDAFTVKGDSVVDFDILRVNWKLAEDQCGEPFESLLDATATVLRQAGAAELMPLWQWVCICELRSHFNYWHGKGKFGGRGWTPAVEKNLTTLLHECSLGVAKTVIHKCFKHLASQLKIGSRPATHLYAMFPGDFLKYRNYCYSNGWPILPWRRTISTEPTYTSLLFDRVLCGGTDFYNRLTGSGLIGCATPPADSEQIT